MRPILLLPLIALAACALSACAQLRDGLTPAAAPSDAAPPVALDATPPPAPSAAATTAEQFDTTSDEDRAAATAAPAATGAETRLGTTTATLGSPADPGIWIEVPYVTEPVPGRVETDAGKSINLELRPSGGAEGSGAEISLPALRLLELPLTAIVELTVYRS